MSVSKAQTEIITVVFKGEVKTYGALRGVNFSACGDELFWLFKEMIGKHTI